MTRILTLFLLILLVFSAASGQSKSIQKADRLFSLEAYPEAEVLYRKIATQDADSSVAGRLAACYKAMGRTGEATKWFGIAARDSGSAENWLAYGQMLQSEGRYGEAVTAFEAYGFASRNFDHARQLIESCEAIETLAGDSAAWQIKPVTLNSAGSEFASAFYQRDLVFAAERDRGFFARFLNRRNGAVFYDLYKAKRRSTEKFETPELMAGGLRSPLHDGPVTFSSDFKIAYVTRSSRRKAADRKAHLTLQTAVAKGEKFSKATALDCNGKEFSTAHAALSPDGLHLYFSSNRPGGLGGNDLYVMHQTAHGWGEPENLGEPVNTPGNEIFPVIGPEGTLYFTSDGHPGLGGLDIFAAFPKDAGWEAVQNLGAPLNSSRDDFALVLGKSGRGYLTSNRPGGKGSDDIYSFQHHTKIEILAVDGGTGSGIAGLQVQVKNTSGSVESITTNAKGRATVFAKPGAKLLLEFSHSDYHAKSEKLTVNAGSLMEKVETKVEMEPLLREIFATGTVKNKTTGEGLPGAEIQIVDNTTREVLRTGTTDADGKFRIPVQTDWDWKIKGSATGFLSEQLTVPTTRDPKTGDFEAVEVELAASEPGEVVRTIYFPYGGAMLSGIAQQDLRDLLTFFRDNPEATFELSAHTDARGPATENLALSNARAWSVRDYLILNGVNANRIVAKGYGETQLLNDCGNHSDCTEEEHARNRRAEVKVLKAPDQPNDD